MIQKISAPQKAIRMASGSMNIDMAAEAAAKAAARKRKRVSRACDACFAKKDRCDAAQPICKVCMQLNRECSYDRPERKRGPAQGIRQRLESQIEILESLLGFVSESFPYVQREAISRLDFARGEASAKAHAQMLDQASPTTSPLASSSTTASNSMQNTYVPPGDIYPDKSKSEWRDSWRKSKFAKAIAPSLGLELGTRCESEISMRDPQHTFVKSEEHFHKGSSSRLSTVIEDIVEAQRARDWLKSGIAIPHPTIRENASSISRLGMHSLPSKESLSITIGRYFATWHTIYSFLDENIVTRYSQELAHDQEQGAQAALVLAVYAAGKCAETRIKPIRPSGSDSRSVNSNHVYQKRQAWSHEQRALVHRWSADAQRILLEENIYSGSKVRDQQFQLDMVNAWLVLSLVDVACDNLDRAWAQVGHAIRLAQRARFDDALTSSPIASLQNSYRRTWALLFYLDTQLSVYFKHVPTTRYEHCEEALGDDIGMLMSLVTLASAAAKDAMNLISNKSQKSASQTHVKTWDQNLEEWRKKQPAIMQELLLSPILNPIRDQEVAKAIDPQALARLNLASSYLIFRASLAHNANETVPVQSVNALQAILQRFVGTTHSPLSPVTLLAARVLSDVKPQTATSEWTVVEMTVQRHALSMLKARPVPGAPAHLSVTTDGAALRCKNDSGGTSRLGRVSGDNAEGDTGIAAPQDASKNMTISMPGTTLNNDLGDNSLALYYALGGPDGHFDPTALSSCLQRSQLEVISPAMSLLEPQPSLSNACRNSSSPASSDLPPADDLHYAQHVGNNKLYNSPMDTMTEKSLAETLNNFAWQAQGPNHSNNESCLGFGPTSEELTSTPLSQMTAKPDYFEQMVTSPATRHNSQSESFRHTAQASRARLGRVEMELNYSRRAPHAKAQPDPRRGNSSPNVFGNGMGITGMSTAAMPAARLLPHASQRDAFCYDRAQSSNSLATAMPWQELTSTSGSTSLYTNATSCENLGATTACNMMNAIPSPQWEQAMIAVERAKGSALPGVVAERAPGAVSNGFGAATNQDWHLGVPFPQQHYPPHFFPTANAGDETLTETQRHQHHEQQQQQQLLAFAQMHGDKQRHFSL